MRIYASIALLLATGTCATAQDQQVKAILDKYQSARPSDEKLAFFSLDWAPDLAGAKARAKKEGRPIFFIWLTNISASTKFFSGHC